MKVPLAGQHPNQPEIPDEHEQFETSIPTSIHKQPTPPQQPPTPPSLEKPFLFRALPFFIGLLVVVLVVFFAIRFIPAIFSKNKGPVELTYWGLWEEEAVINSVIDDYKKENPNIKITYQKQNVKQYRETVTDRLSKGEGPDIFRFHNTWVPMMGNFLAPVPSDVYSKEEFKKTFYPVAQKDLQVGNDFIGIPLEIDTLALFINDDDFKAAGITPPRTWQELRDATVALTIKTSDNRIQKAGVALGTFDNIDHASDILALMMLQNGVDLKKVNNSLSKDGRDLAEDTLGYYTSFAQGEERVWDDTLDPSSLAFAKEKLSMYFGYSWDIFTIKTLNPSLNFRVVPVPQLPGGTKTFASYWVEGVSKNSKFQKEAFAFLKFLSKAGKMQKLFAQQSQLRLFGEPYSRVDLADSLKSHQYLAAFVEQAKDATSWYLVSNTYDNGLNDGMIKYFSDAIRAVGKGVSPKTALETLAKGVETVATQYGL